MKRRIVMYIIPRIIQGDCVKEMRNLQSDIIDLTVTSPPYDNLRTYNGYSFDFENTAKEIYRLTKKGGVVVWIVGDATINGSETGTSFRQALYFKDCGFNLHDTMIWNKGKFSAVGALATRYAPVFEYMFVFSKGKLKTFNPLIDRKNKVKGRISGNIRQKDGSFKPMSTAGNMRREFGQRFNIWEQCPDTRQLGHPAIFPEALAQDHIISWSNAGDVVFDPFMGSGTTGKMAILNGREFIGIDISPEYCELARKRIEGEKNVDLFSEIGQL
jgi:DNA modification methylase